MLQKLLFLLPLAVAVLAQTPRSITLGSQLASVSPPTLPSTILLDSNFSYPGLLTPQNMFAQQTLEPGVIYEPKIILVPKKIQPTSVIDGSGTKVPPQEVPRVPPQVVPRVPPQVVPRVPPQVVPRVPPQVVPRVPPQVVPRVPPQVVPRVPPQVVPRVPPQVVPRVPPQVVPRVPPQVVPRVPPQVVPRVPPQVVPRVPPQVVPRIPPQEVPRVSPQVVTQKPPSVVFVTPRPRPTGPFKTEFQCPESNGFYSVANSCDTYIECQGYVAERRTCPNGLYFNPAAKYSNYSPCAYPSEVQCTTGNVIQRPQPNPNPNGQCPASSGNFGINDGDCSRFLMCQEGIATIMNCPAGLVFNDKVQVCDWPANVPQCTPNVLKDFTCPATPVDKNGEMSDITYKYRYGVQCKSFVACHKGRPRLLSCDPGLSFDETSQSCINDEFVTNCAAPYSAAVA